MTYRGHIKNGVAVLDGGVKLPEGAEVRVEPVAAVVATDQQPAIWRKLLELAGSVKGLPSDAARQHDHYLYGTAKR